MLCQHDDVKHPVHELTKYIRMYSSYLTIQFYVNGNTGRALIVLGFGDIYILYTNLIN